VVCFVVYTDEGGRVSRQGSGPARGGGGGPFPSPWRSLDREPSAGRRRRRLRKSELAVSAASSSQTFQLAGIVALDGILTAVNRTAVEFSGARESIVVGKFFWDTPWWEHSEELRNWLREAVSRGCAGRDSST